MNIILAILTSIPAIGKIFSQLENLLHKWELEKLERAVLKDKKNIELNFKLQQGKKAMSIADARERAKALRDIFNS